MGVAGTGVEGRKVLGARACHLLCFDVAASVTSVVILMSEASALQSWASPTVTPAIWAPPLHLLLIPLASCSPFPKLLFAVLLQHLHTTLLLPLSPHQPSDITPCFAAVQGRITRFQHGTLCQICAQRLSGELGLCCISGGELFLAQTHPSLQVLRVTSSHCFRSRSPRTEQTSRSISWGWVCSTLLLNLCVSISPPHRCETFSYRYPPFLQRKEKSFFFNLMATLSL